MMILKSRARKPCAKGPVWNVGYSPTGVGGMDEKPVVSFGVGDHIICLYLREFNELTECIRQSVEAHHNV